MLFHLNYQKNNNNHNLLCNSKQPIKPKIPKKNHKSF